MEANKKAKPDYLIAGILVGLSGLIWVVIIVVWLWSYVGEK